MNLGAQELVILIIFVGLPVGAGYLIYKAVADRSEAKRLDLLPPPPTSPTPPPPVGASQSSSSSSQSDPPPPRTPAGWYPDPSGRHELRYHDGTDWTIHVSTGGTESTDAI